MRTTPSPAQKQVVFVGHRESSTTRSKVSLKGSPAISTVSLTRRSKFCPRRTALSFFGCTGARGAGSFTAAATGAGGAAARDAVAGGAVGGDAVGADTVAGGVVGGGAASDDVDPWVAAGAPIAGGAAERSDVLAHDTLATIAMATTDIRMGRMCRVVVAEHRLSLSTIRSILQGWLIYCLTQPARKEDR